MRIVFSHYMIWSLYYSSLATEMVKGKTIDEALNIRNSDIAGHLRLPPVKLHCSMYVHVLVCLPSICVIYITKHASVTCTGWLRMPSELLSVISKRNKRSVLRQFVISRYSKCLLISLFLSGDSSFSIIIKLWRMELQHVLPVICTPLPSYPLCCMLGVCQT